MNKKINQDNTKEIVDIKEVLKSHAAHLLIANEEMSVIKNDIIWLKEIVKKIDDRTWYILVSIIVAVFIQIGLHFIK